MKFSFVSSSSRLRTQTQSWWVCILTWSLLTQKKGTKNRIWNSAQPVEEERNEIYNDQRYDQGSRLYVSLILSKARTNQSTANHTRWHTLAASYDRAETVVNGWGGSELLILSWNSFGIRYLVIGLCFYFGWLTVGRLEHAYAYGEWGWMERPAPGVSDPNLRRRHRHRHRRWTTKLT